jgi:DNA helicase-2/ATP-dependent DNA helicase PcrA
VFFLSEKYKNQLALLSSSQRRCAEHNEGYALVLAGPGSGKTKVITMRAARLILKGHKVLTMSFNKKAAEEMKKRTFDILAEEREMLDDFGSFSTIHSFCFNVMKMYRKYKKLPSVKIIDEEKQSYIISEIYYNLTNNSLGKEELREIVSFISRKNCNSEGDNGNNSELKVRQYNCIYDHYQKMKVLNNFIDFDDMLIICHNILKENMLFCEEIKKMYDYIQIDEGQDVSLVQIEIIKLIGNNIFIVGDDDQSIYGFRGADPRLLIEFAKEDKCKKYYLERNYRCAMDITYISSEFIKKNITRFKKDIYTDTDNIGKVSLKCFKNEIRQAYSVANLIIKYYKNHVTTAVLYRNNISALCPLIAIIILYFLRKDESPDISLPDDIFYDNEFKAFEEMIRLQEFDDDIADCIIYKYRVTGRRRFFINSLKAAARMVCIRIPEDKKETIIEIINNIFNKKNLSDNNGMICFSTIHSAKGLEYDNVVIVDNVQGEFPINYKECAQLDEERRLFYVAMTRAKNNLHVVYPEKHYDKKVVPGIFVDETKNILRAYY